MSDNFLQFIWNKLKIYIYVLVAIVVAAIFILMIYFFIQYQNKIQTKEYTEIYNEMDTLYLQWLSEFDVDKKNNLKKDIFNKFSEIDISKNNTAVLRAYFLLADMEELDENYLESIKYYDIILDKSYKNRLRPIAFIKKANSLRRLSKNKEAVLVYQNFIDEKAPSTIYEQIAKSYFPEVLFNLAILSENDAQYDEARRHYQALLDLDSTSDLAKITQNRLIALDQKDEKTSNNP